MGRWATDKVVRSCARCGAGMEPGERARIGIDWEVAPPDVHGGHYASAPRKKSRSAMLCRACAVEAARLNKVAVPGEVFAFPPLEPPLRDARAAVRGAGVFLSGPMTGLPDWNRAAFAAAEELVVALGAARVYNPAAGAPHGPDAHGHAHWMLRTLHDLTAHAAGAGGGNECAWGVGVMLPGWRDSEGARLEREVMLACGVGVVEEADLR